MPTRKINDSPQELPLCRDREHDPPNMMVYANGTYEHECPSCGSKCRFFVQNPTLTMVARFGSSARDPDDLIAWEEAWRRLAGSKSIVMPYRAWFPSRAR